MIMIRKKILLVILMILFLSVLGFWLAKAKLIKGLKSDRNRPNLILISLDSLRADHVSAYGYSRKTTPNIDDLAKEGVLFKNYITQAYLSPVSETALHTGMYPSSSGVVGLDFVLPEDILTLAQILKIYNYQTIALGNYPEFEFFPAKETFSRGFDVYKFRRENGDVFGNVLPTNISPVQNVLPNQEEINKTLDFLKEGKEPFFIWLAIGSAHFPCDGFYNSFSRHFGDLNYNGPLKDSLLTCGGEGVSPRIFNDVFYKTKGEEITEKINLNQEDIQYVIDRYDDKIFVTDEWIGDFLKELKKRSLDRNTIIILASEHGEEFNERGYINDIFDSEIKPPLIIRNPKLKEKGLIIERQVQSIDVLPTILDFLNIPKHHQVEGNSLAPLIAGKAPEDFNRYVFIERISLWKESGNRFIPLENNQPFFYLLGTFQDLQGDPFFRQRDAAIRTNEWKLIYRKSKDFQEKYSWWRILSKDKQKRRDYELYNLKTDPEERENVIDEYPIVAENLKERLRLFIEKTEGTEIEAQRREVIQEYL